MQLGMFWRDIVVRLLDSQKVIALTPLPQSPEVPIDRLRQVRRTFVALFL